LTGLIGQAHKFSYSDLVLMNSVRQTVTMECAGNISGGPGVGNAAWSGVPLSELLTQAGVKSVATGVIFYGADASDGVDAPADTHFARCIPLEKAMAPATLLAYEMNGSPLPAEHGFPLRAIVPGWYGMDSVKWLTRIEVTDKPFEGYFQQKYYSAVDAKGAQRPITRMLVNSKFLRPSEGEEILAKSYRIEGVAWAGEGKIVKVELRTGPDEPWQAAAIADATEPMTWVSWSYEWHVPRPGRCTLEVRATDDSGHRQPDVRDPERRDAYELNTPHRIAVTVRS
jgi:DMSO/TMAO reductase YedYZ molybdopterin-dependent catalytic subunit